jgi:SAM-dependent methyltransferase
MKMTSLLRALQTNPLSRLVLYIPGTRSIAKRAYSLFSAQEVLEEPDRRFLVEVILPAIRRARPHNLLFVGCQRYTVQYYEYFSEAGIECWTVDIDPACARWGAKRNHIVGDFQFIDRYCDVIFDAVIMNGVFGYGIDTPEHMERSLVKLWKILKPGGFMVLGWNTDRIPDPNALSAFKTYFSYHSTAPLSGRHPIPSSTHIYDFLDARVLPPL